MFHPALRVAIIGGGPGGLFTAYLLQHRHGTPVDITIYEASERLGGKIVTQQFGSPSCRYEAGAAELYDYSAVGPDPLRELLEELRLTTHAIKGRGVFMEGRFIKDDDHLGEMGGEAAQAAYEAFRRQARSLISPSEYYESDWKEENGDPLHQKTFDEFLATIKDPFVRRYIEVSVHSDVATEPRHTSASYGLQNYLMNERGYMQLYGIDGGIEQLPRALVRRLSATIKLGSRVSSVRTTADGMYAVKTGESQTEDEFDFVVVALPNYWIPGIEWSGEALAQAMRRHHAHYDYPAHYLRVAIRFAQPFWRETVDESYFMLDAFGGCCVYDESSRCRDSSGAVLGWLIAGEDAMALSNLDDAVLIKRVLDSLPPELARGRELAIEGRVHRWVGAVNARPGGYPLYESDARHVPDPEGNPWLFVVGDYLFDSTLNGALDSADCVAEAIDEEVAEELAVGEVSAVESK